MQYTKMKTFCNNNEQGWGEFNFTPPPLPLLSFLHIEFIAFVFHNTFPLLWWSTSNSHGKFWMKTWSKCPQLIPSDVFNIMFLNIKKTDKSLRKYHDRQTDKQIICLLDNTGEQPRKLHFLHSIAGRYTCKQVNHRVASLLKGVCKNY